MYVCMCGTDLDDAETEDNAVALHDDVFTSHARLEHSPVTQRIPAPHILIIILIISVN